MWNWSIFKVPGYKYLYVQAVFQLYVIAFKRYWELRLKLWLYCFLSCLELAAVPSIKKALRVPMLEEAIECRFHPAFLKRLFVLSYGIKLSYFTVCFHWPEALCYLIIDLLKAGFSLDRI